MTRKRSLVQSQYRPPGISAGQRSSLPDPGNELFVCCSIHREQNGSTRSFSLCGWDAEGAVERVNTAVPDPGRVRSRRPGWVGDGAEVARRSSMTGTPACTRWTPVVGICRRPICRGWAAPGTPRTCRPTTAPHSPTPTATTASGNVSFSRVTLPLPAVLPPRRSSGAATGSEGPGLVVVTAVVTRVSRVGSR
jgi:hypothetical protein